MTQVLVTYATDYGSTKAMAEAVGKGAQSVPETQVVLKEVTTVTPEELLAADAIIMGTPVHMAACDWRIKQFIDKVCGPCWMKDKAVGKVAGVFGTGAGYGQGGSGCELAMLSMLGNLAELGCIIVPLPKRTKGYSEGGLHWGPYGRSSDDALKSKPLNAGALQAAEAHGANIARVAKALQGKELLT